MFIVNFKELGIMKYKYKNLVVAYGSNLCGEDWNRFASRNGIDGKCLNFEEVVTIPDYKLVFNTASRSRNGGVLNIQKAKGYVVPAGLFSVSQTGLELLRRKEGVPFKYLEENISVIQYDGSEIAALTYIVPPEGCEPYVEPHPDYLQVCLDGYNAYGMDTEDLLRASKNQLAKPLTALFAYGTLMRNESRFATALKHGINCALVGQIFGRLTTNGSYPALNLCEDGYAWGDYLVSDNITSLLTDTDLIEGFLGFGQEGSLFRRTCVEVDVGGVGQRFSWVYVMNSKLDLDIISNDWRAHRSKRTQFVSNLVESHAMGVTDFGKQVCDRYYRFGTVERPDEFSIEKIKELIADGDILSERHLAQISGLWAALSSDVEQRIN